MSKITGMKQSQVKMLLKNNCIDIYDECRNGNNTGVSIKCKDVIVNVFDSGSVNIQGNECLLKNTIQNLLVNASGCVSNNSQSDTDRNNYIKELKNKSKYDLIGIASKKVYSSVCSLSEKELISAIMASKIIIIPLQ